MCYVNVLVKAFLKPFAIAFAVLGGLLLIASSSHPKHVMLTIIFGAFAWLILSLFYVSLNQTKQANQDTP